MQLIVERSYIANKLLLMTNLTEKTANVIVVYRFCNINESDIAQLRKLDDVLQIIEIEKKSVFDLSEIDIFELQLSAI